MQRKKQRKKQRNKRSILKDELKKIYYNIIKWQEDVQGFLEFQERVKGAVEKQ